MDFLRRHAAYLVPLAFLLIAGVSLLGWTLHPGRSGWLMLPALYCLVLVLDRASFGWAHPARAGAAAQTQFALRMFISVTALIVGLSILVVLAVSVDWLERSWAFSARKTAGLLGSMVIIVMGNFLPKLPSPWRHAEEPFDWQGVHRFAGTVFMLAGLVSLMGWALLPIGEARVLSRVVFVAMALVVVARKWHSLATWPTRSRRRGTMQS